jgi:signal transduction histidine kinase
VPALDWLDPRNALHILRILQEAFTNIVKHAHATEIRVATKVENNFVAVTVTDNGQGFSLAHALKNGGKGLFNQMRRAESIGAEICLDSNNEVGTRLTLRLPIKRKYAAE